MVESGQVLEKGPGEYGERLNPSEYRRRVESGRVPEKSLGEYWRKVESGRVPEKG